MNRFLLILLFVGFSLFSIAQSQLQLYGRVSDHKSKKSLAAVTVTVYDGASVVKTVQTSGAGSFNIMLPFNKSYKITVKKAGKVEKFFNVDVDGVVEEDLPAGNLKLQTDMTLFDDNPSVDFSFLKSTPVALFYYDEMSGSMDFNRGKLKKTKSRIDKLLEEAEEQGDQEDTKRADFEKLMSEGQALYGNKNYAGALQKYEAAKNLIPDDPLVKARIAEVNEKIAALQKEADYNKFITEADQSFGNKSYEVALGKYNQALNIKPNESHPTNRIIEIEELLAKAKKDAADAEKIEQEYRNFLKAGENLEAQNNLEGALTQFKSALALKPKESYPAAKIKNIEEKLALIKGDEENKAKYDLLIKDADQKFTAKDYENAKAVYTQASQVLPNEDHPNTRITEINKILADQAKEKELNEKYDALVKSGNDLFNGSSWELAKAKYEAALLLKPTEQYPKDQLVKITDEIKNAEANAALEAAYNKLIDEAKALFATKDYEAAKVKYQEAIQKKDQEFPKEEIKKIDKLLLDLKSEQENQAAYDKLMQEGEDLKNTKEYEAAIKKFANALVRKPSETIPQTKIDEINAIIKKQEEDDKLALIEKQYEGYMSDGNSKMVDSKFSTAIEDYKSALLVKPNDPDATAKIKEAELKIKEAEDLAKKEAEQKAYDELIEAGTNLMGTEDWTDAKVKFEDALKMRPSEELPKTKIAEIEKKLSAMDAEEAKEKQYNSLIGSADDYYNQEKLTEAKEKYEAALAIKPSESHPSERIIAIEKKLADLASQDAILKEYQEKLKLADDAFASGDFEGSIPLYETAGIVDPSQIYPNSQILKAQEKIKISASNKEEAEYQKIIAAADGLKDDQKFDLAIAKYEEALVKKANEAYPKQQIENIRELIQKQKDAALNKEKADKDYQEYLKKGADAMASGNLETALDHYQNAAIIKPAEALPPQKISEIKGLIAQQNGAKEIEEKYNTYVKQGDDLMSANDFKGAITAYNSALTFKANEPYPTEQIKKAQEFLAATNVVKDNKEYDKFMKEGNKYLAQDNMLDAAEDYFNRALMEKPGDQIALDKINEINQIRDDLAQSKLDKAAAEANYLKVMNEADNLFEQKKWEEAQNRYTDARNIFDRTRPQEQIELCRKNRLANKSEGSAQYIKLIKVADKKFVGEDYEKAKELYTRAIKLSSTGDTYPREQLKKIEEILFEKDKTEVDLSDLGEPIAISIEEMSRKFKNAISNQDYIETKEIENVKDQFQDSEEKLGDKQTRNINDLKINIDEYKKDTELLNVKMDDNRKENEVRVVEFGNKIYKNNKELSSIEWMDIERTKSDIDLAIKNQGERFVEADLNRQDMEKKIVAYNVDMNKNFIEKSRNNEIQISQLKSNIENKEMEMSSAFNSMDNSRVETTENKELYVDNLDIYNAKKAHENIDGIHKVGNDIAEMKINIEKRDLASDDNRKETVKNVEAYEDQLEISDQKVAEDYVERSRDVKEEADLLVYKTEKHNGVFDDKRKDNIKTIEKFEDNREKESGKLGDQATGKSDAAKKLADELMVMRNGDFNEKIANDLADKFPEGMTEEIFQQKNEKGEILGFVVRRIVVAGDRGDIFIMRQNRFGTTFTKNGAPTTQFVWDDESLR